MKRKLEDEGTVEASLPPKRPIGSSPRAGLRSPSSRGRDPSEGDDLVQISLNGEGQGVGISGARVVPLPRQTSV